MSRWRETLEELVWAIEMAQDHRAFMLMVVRCNYGAVQQAAIEVLREQLRDAALVGEMRWVDLGAGGAAEAGLIGKLRLEQQLQAWQQEPGLPAGMVVYGLDSIDFADLAAFMNQNRGQFLNHWHFPLVLFLRDPHYTQFQTLAPDVESIGGGSSLSLEPEGGELATLLGATVTGLFAALVDPTVRKSLAGLLRTLMDDLESHNDRGWLAPAELEPAIAQLLAQDRSIPTDFRAKVLFLRGVAAAVQGRSDRDNETALAFLDQSFQAWEDLGDQYSLDWGILQYFRGYIGYFVQNERKDQQREQWNFSVEPLQEAIAAFEAAQREDLVPKVLGHWCMVLHRLRDWPALEAAARRSIDLQQRYGKPHWVARAMGFLGEARFQQGDLGEGEEWLRSALGVLERSGLQRWEAVIFWRLLGEIALAQNQPDAALDSFYKAKAQDFQGHPTVYAKILVQLQRLHRDRGEYWQAFCLKQEQLAVENQYGLRAFVGSGRLEQSQQQRGQSLARVPRSDGVAPEIRASGRQKDLEKLLYRISDNGSKLIVIHGFSGVGKSSLVNGGIVPALRAKPIGYRLNVVGVVQRYQDWRGEVSRELGLGEGMGEVSEWEAAFFAAFTALRNANNRLILVFDQFEEFFFSAPDPLERRQFFDFLGRCLQEADLKVILSLREDYLYYLLECQRLESFTTTGMDILSRGVLYGLGNFRVPEAIEIMTEMVARSRYYLEPALIEQLAVDLGGKLEEVRPIEMQIVGVQLQTLNIHTLGHLD